MYQWFMSFPPWSKEKRIAALFSRAKRNHKTGCLEIKRGLKNGYGFIAFASNGKTSIEYAHRLAWKAAKGEIPDGLCVLHKCDNRTCINIDHLFLGTKKENSIDMARKGRQGNQNLTESMVRMIKSRFRAGETQAELAWDYGVSNTMVHRIINRKVWKWVK